ncbi:FecCD family ABC transporter permease [Microbacterium esteraromaticum]|uniref:FecCD family ABC transporter permease n=1 Tax=Microbacterium esteraromaticum TaxID=57043 RepID=UPI003242A044
MIGFDVGAYTAVVITILVLDGGSSWSLTAAALVGGLGTAIVVYALAYRRGIRGFRLIVVGIAVAAMLGSVNAYLVTRADIDGAMTVGFWAAGSLDRVTWAGVIPAVLVAAAVVLVVFVAARDLRSLELGDDAACMQGTRVTRARLVLLVAGVASTALVTAAAGPIAFVALAAPQLAKRLTRSPGVSLIAAAAMGAALLAAAQLLALIIAQLYRPIPVGLLTVCIGGLYLVWLLIREARRHTTGS